MVTFDALHSVKANVAWLADRAAVGDRGQQVPAGPVQAGGAA